MTGRRIYFDNNASSPVSPEALSVMLPFFSEVYGNPSSLHLEGCKAAEAVKKAASAIASAFGGVNPDCITFTESGTDANSLALAGFRKKILRSGRTKLHFITSSIEHSSVLEVFRHFETIGDQVTYIEPDSDGLLSPDAFAAAITPDTVLASVMLANNETGTVQPFLSIIKTLHNAGIPVHCDAVQAFGKIPLDIIKCPADMISIASHKINGPKGAGALYVKRNVQIEALLRGSHSKTLKPGTVNVPAIAGFGKAAELAMLNLNENIRHSLELKKLFLEGLKDAAPSAVINGTLEKSLSNTVNVSFPGLESAYLVEHFDEAGLAVSAASACASSTKGSSHVLRAMKLSQERLSSAIRFSFGIYNTTDEVSAALEIIRNTVNRNGQ